MHRKLSSVGLALALALATTLAAAAPGAASDERERKRVLIKDDCDPATFNAAGFGNICQGKGETTFSEFIAELQEDRAVDDWTFDPDELSVVAGAKVTVKNVGGETHTLTRVAAFGPGVVPLLNQLVFGREGPPQPEFLPFDPAHNANLNLVPSGGTLALSTGLGQARNAVIVTAADSVIAIGAGWGTLSEIALARRLDRPVFALDTWKVSGLETVDSPAEAVKRALEED